MTKNIILQIDDYKRILNNNKKHFDNISTICKQIGEKVEGNCFTEHLNIDNIMTEKITKQLNHLSLGMNATNIMEIGFIAGHSSLLYLLSNPNSKLTIFDIYVRMLIQFHAIDIYKKCFPIGYKFILVILQKLFLILSIIIQILSLT